MVSHLLLANFGIAREFGEISGLAATNMFLGSTVYGSPEQLQGLELDGGADQYALGCTAFHLLTGYAPYEDSNPAILIAQHLMELPPLISERKPELAGLDAIFARALAKRSANRYPSCSDFAAALGGLLGTGSAEFLNINTTTSAPTRVVEADRTTSSTPKKHRRKGLAVAAAAVIALAAGGAFFGFKMYGQSQQSFGALPQSARATSPTADAGKPLASPPSADTPQLAEAPEYSGEPSGEATSTPASGASGSSIQLSRYVTDDSGVLNQFEAGIVQRSSEKLYSDCGTRFWVVYVNSFAGSKPAKWVENTRHANGVNSSDAVLAIATDDKTYYFTAPSFTGNGKATQIDLIRRDLLDPAVARGEWTRAAISVANGLDLIPG
ncbi:TPM domain-containing protein [Mycobacterium montefiorense]|nr:TPM domain-containing protein [Mycobacterium montefiorense]